MRILQEAEHPSKDSWRRAEGGGDGAEGLERVYLGSTCFGSLGQPALVSLAVSLSLSTSRSLSLPSHAGRGFGESVPGRGANAQPTRGSLSGATTTHELATTERAGAAKARGAGEGERGN